MLQGTTTYAELLSIFGADGSYNAIASATDSAGITGSLAFLVEVKGPNEPPFPTPAPADPAAPRSGLLGMGWQRRRTEGARPARKTGGQTAAGFFGLCPGRSGVKLSACFHAVLGCP